MFVSQWEDEQLRWNCLTDDANKDTFVSASIGKLLAEKQWCLNGWEITSRQVVTVSGLKMLHVEGSCR